MTDTGARRVKRQMIDVLREENQDLEEQLRVVRGCEAALIEKTITTGAHAIAGLVLARGLGEGTEAMSGARGPFAVGDGEEAEGTPAEEAVVFNDPPGDETTLTYYVLVRRRPREVFLGSSIFIGSDLEDAKKQVVESVFGTGFPCSNDDILKRYNVDVVELTDDLEQELNELTNPSPSCPDLS